MRYFPTIVLVLAFFATGSYGQTIDWKSTGAFLPKGNYTLHISWDQQLYTSNSGLIYKYIPNASTWSSLITQPFTHLIIISDSLAFGFDNTFGSYSTMFKIRDGWKKQDTIAADEFGQFGKMHVADDTTIYYSKSGHGIGGVLRSVNLGTTWDTLRHDAFLSESILALSSDNHKVLYIQTEQNIFRTADGGQSWDTVYDGLTFDPPRSFVIQDEDVYVLTGTGNFLKNAQFVTSLPFTGTIYRGGAGHLYVSTSQHLLRSRNGLDWDTIFVNLLPGKFASDSSGTLYSVLTDGIYTSSDHGDTWTLMTGFQNRRFTTFGTTADSILYGNYLFSRDDGFTWDTVDITGLNSPLLPVWGESGDLMTIAKDSVKKQYFATKLSLEAPWSPSPLLPHQDKVNPYFIFGRFPTNELWAINADGLLSVIDNAGTWHDTHVAGHPSSDIFIAEAVDGQTIIASGLNRIYRSLNNGFSFVEVSQLASGDVAELIVSNGEAIHLLTSSDIDHYSTDQGATWTTFFLPKDEEVTDLAVAGNGALYASTTAGVFCNTKGFNNPFVWEDISGILKGVHLEHVAVRDNKRLYVATTTGNVYFTDLPGSSVTSPKGTSDASMVYPNPVMDRCYLAGVDDSAIVEIYDLLGIRVLHSPYQGRLDVSNIPAGVYQIVVDNFRANLVIHR